LVKPTPPPPPLLWLSLRVVCFFNLPMSITYIKGTSTHDGAAVAKATLIYLIKQIKCATLFVTHYPEISDVVREIPCNNNQVVNLHMKCMVSGTMTNGVEDVVFLYEVIHGEAGASHGINVAQLAGVPSHLVSIALSKLQSLKQEEMIVALGEEKDHEAHVEDGFLSSDALVARKEEEEEEEEEELDQLAITISKKDKGVLHGLVSNMLLGESSLNIAYEQLTHAQEMI
jgi:DNA mismatch repair ATPase MutS